ncbi:hypothetical protein BLNAU_1202 [Blattamonas nauphoetae]|uniref:Uncharacterized protein n=1 Tax=Blattamonas nauphoetae TaxID=2049346 RepID=A0ABQ9YIP7_9EUKA|nr:hypothetical protein BLNAU_1202 [Blattamonas nauphoetae]
MQYSPTNQMIPPLSPTNRRAKTRRMRQIQLPENPDDVIENLHRYPLLVWYDPTASNDSEDSLLNDNHTKTLRSLVASKCETGEEVEWQDLMEWFVCAVIGLNSRASWISDSFLFDWDDVVVDGFGTARINVFASHSDSSPPHSPQSFSDGIIHLSLLFLSLIGQLSTSNCLSKRTEQHSPTNVISSVIHHLIDHLVTIGHLIPPCDPSEFTTLVKSALAAYVEPLPDDPSWFDDWKWITVHAYCFVKYFEDEGMADHSVRLTDADADPCSQLVTKFIQLLDPVLDEVKKRFDPKMIEEARRIKSWKEFLQKVAGGEEVENDTSFLKLPFFRPTLLSLQAKFQQLTSSLDGSDENSTSSLHSSHSSPNTSLAAHLDSSLRTNSSSSHFKQESLELLNILHSLLTSPLPPSLHKHSPIDNFEPFFAPVDHDDISPTERFNSSLFDEVDNEKLARSLHRCLSVCKLVGAETCIDDVPEFFDRTISVLGSSNSQLRAVAFTLFTHFDTTSSCIRLLPRLWNRLRSAFRDGQLEEQFALVRISTNWIMKQMESHPLPPFQANQFDWDGLINADLSDSFMFIYSIILIENIRHSSITEQIGKTNATHIILSFEQHHNAVSRIVSIFDGTERVDDYLRFSQSLISYCLLISLLSNREFPPTLTTFITQDPDIDAITLLFLHENNLFLLCHTSLNQHKPFQPPLDLLFERTLRMHPFLFFTCSREFGDISLSLSSTLRCVEWLNLPTGFGSALAFSNTHMSFDRIEDQDTQHINSDTSLQLTHHPLTMLDGLSTSVNNTTDRIFQLGALTRGLSRDFQAEVSAFLEFLKRVVSLGSVENVMEMVRFGMLDIVIRIASESSFLEDYENGICVIGILLRSIRDLENEEEMEDHDFSLLLSQTGLSCPQPPGSLTTPSSSISSLQVCSK